MNTRPIGGPLDLAALVAPPGICANCYRTFRATTRRPRFVWCWHSRTAARERRGGGWITLENVTPTELRALQEGHGT